MNLRIKHQRVAALGAIAAIALAVSLTLGPLKVGAQDDAATQTRAFWRSFAVSALDIEPASSFDEVIAGSDAIVLGRLAAIGPGRVVGEPVEGIPGAQVLFANVTVAVTEVLMGELPQSHRAEFTLEVLLPGRRDFSELTTLNTTLPRSQSIFFVRSNATTAAAMGLPAEVQEREQALYHLTVQRALLSNEGGRAIAPIWTDHDDFFQQFEGRAFNPIVHELRSEGS